jgi:serine/threonine-protein kinase HipA
MSTHTLNVLDSAAQIGTVEYESLDERFSFQYTDDWRKAVGSYSISPHIELRGQQASASGTVRRFLENLLPEGRALDVVCTTHQVAKNNLYGLIRELGQETSGALSFVAGEARQAKQTARREIHKQELKQRIDERARIPFAVWDGRVRMSIAGYQDKLAVYLDQDNRMYLVEGELASTHILKPEPMDNRLAMLVANEHFSMSLARRLGLSVASVSILRVPDPILLVERFDRVRQTQRVHRRHIIDSCQALNFPVAYKYERNFGSGREVRDIRDGVSFERLFSVADYTVEKAVTRIGLLRWALFQYLIGNSDAHGKNVSFFCNPAGLALAPHYDLVSVVQYDGLDHELAMAYGDEFHLEQIRPYDWAEFAARTGTPRSLLMREMRRIGTIAPEAAALQAAETLYEGQEKALVSRIAEFVRRQATKLIEMASSVMAVSLD